MLKIPSPPSLLSPLVSPQCPPSSPLTNDFLTTMRKMVKTEKISTTITPNLHIIKTVFITLMNTNIITIIRGMQSTAIHNHHKRIWLPWLIITRKCLTQATTRNHRYVAFFSTFWTRENSTKKCRQTSLEQYAMFPGPKRSATPGQNQATHPTQFGLPSASQNYQTYPSSGSNAPDQLPPGKKFLCSLCIAGFERRYDLKRHMHTHSDQKEFVCPKCEKGLARHDSLTRHLTVCKGPKP